MEYVNVCLPLSMCPHVGLHAQESDEVDPQEAANEGVGRAHDEGQDAAHPPIPLEHPLDAALFNHACNHLVPVQQKWLAFTTTGSVFVQAALHRKLKQWRRMTLWSAQPAAAELPICGGCT